MRTFFPEDDDDERSTERPTETPAEPQRPANRYMGPLPRRVTPVARRVSPDARLHVGPGRPPEKPDPAASRTAQESGASLHPPRQPTPRPAPSAQTPQPTPEPTPTVVASAAPPASDETFLGIAQDVWARLKTHEWGRHQQFALGVLGVVVIIALVFGLCSLAQQIIGRTAEPSTPSTPSTPNAPSPSGHLYQGVVAVSYIAGRSTTFSGDVTIDATLYWATTTPTIYSCGAFALRFTSYQRPTQVPCRLTLPPQADGVAKDAFQNCIDFHDPVGSVVCWENPTAFTLAP